MPWNVIAFASSPRIDGNSDILCGGILAGARSAGGEIEKIHLDKLHIAPCLGCEKCLESVEAPCVIDDDMSALIEKIKNADGLVFASPIYFCSVNGQMKIFLDRLNAIFDRNYNALAGKKAALAFSYAEKDALKSGVFNAYQMFRDAFDALNMNFVGCVHAACPKKNEISENKDILKEAFLIGRNFN